MSANVAILKMIIVSAVVLHIWQNSFVLKQVLNSLSWRKELKFLRINSEPDIVLAIDSLSLKNSFIITL